MLLDELMNTVTEATEKRQRQWREAQKKYHNKKKKSGKKEIRTFVSKSTKLKLKTKAARKEDDMGSAIDKEVD